MAATQSTSAHRGKQIKVPGYTGPERRVERATGVSMEVGAKQLEGMVEKAVTELVTQRIPEVIHQGVHKALVEAQRAHAVQAPAPTQAQVLQAQADAIHRARTQNGVKEPGDSGKCRDIWNALDVLVQRNQAVTVQLAKDSAVANGWNPRNAVIEFYRWKRFNGYQAPAQAPQQAAQADAAPEPAAPQQQAIPPAPAPRKRAASKGSTRAKKTQNNTKH